MLKRFTRYVTQSVAGMIGISVYVLSDTFFISVYSGADGLAVLNLILPVYGLIYAIGAMIGIGSATRYAISRAKGKNTEHYFVQSVTWSILAAVPFMLIGIFIPDKALALLGADAGLIGLGRNYVRIILIATPLFAIKAGDLLDSVKKQGLHPASPAKNSYSRRNIQFFYFTIKDFLLLTTSKITAASRTRPLTTFCRFWSIPMILIPKFSTPISNAPMITPGTVPVPP